MAHLTGSQKKSRNKFIALLVAILVVAAAIFYVVYASVMAKSAYLENQDFATALATAFDKDARKVSQDDLSGVKYVEIYNDGSNTSVFLGYDNFVEQYKKYVAEVEARTEAEEAGAEELPEITTEHPAALAINGSFETDSDEELVLNDIKYFTGAEIVSFSGISFDAAAMSQYKNLKEASFTYCSLTNEDLAAIAGSIDLTKIEKLTFMGNSIDDWSPVESISDKVTIASYGYTIDENGQLAMTSNEQTLTEYLAAQAEAENAENETAEESETEETVEESTEEVSEEAVEGTEETTEETTEEVTEETTEVTE